MSRKERLNILRLEGVGEDGFMISFFMISTIIPPAISLLVLNFSHSIYGSFFCDKDL